MSRMQIAILPLVALALAGPGRMVRSGADPAKAGPGGRPPSFTRDIQPLFQAKCLRCHGGKVRRGGLDLRTLAAVREGGESGPAVVPGQPDRSPLYEKVHGGTMPPGKKDR